MAKLDELTIEIKDNAKETAKNFDTLSNSLKKLSNVDTKSVYKNLNSVSRILKNFSNEIKGLDTSKINSLATAMNSMAYSTKKSMQSASKSVDNVNKNLSNSTKKSKQTVDEFMASIKGIGKNQQFFGSSSQLNTEIASTKNKIEKVKTALEAYNQEGKSVETKGWRTAQRQLEQYTNYLDTLMSKQRLATSTAKGFQFDEKAIAGSKENIYKLLLSDAEYNKMRESILAKQPIEIPTTIKTDNISKTISNSISKVTPINTKSITEQVTKAEKTVQDASAKMRSALMFEPTKLGIGQKYTKEYTVLEKEILKAEKELEKYLNTQEKLDTLGVKNDSQRYKNVQLNIDQTDAKLQKLYQDMKILQTEGGDIINPNAFDNLSDKSSKAQSVMQSLTKALRTGGFGGAASIVQKLSANVGSLSSGLEMSGAAAETAGTAMAGLQTAIPVIGIILAAVTLLIKAFTSLAKTVVNVAKKIGNGLKKIVTGVKNLVSNILSIGTSSYQAHTAVGKFINKVVNMFKSRVLRQAITKAIEYAKQGFKDLDAYSANIGSPFHRNVQTIIADLKWLGRSIAAAFEPIINVATPILDWLIDKIVTVINYINQFFAALTGKSTWTKATKGASDYADATGGASKAQKDLNKQIREWDKLNVITDPNKNNGSGGSNSSSGGGGGFTTEEVDNGVKDFVKKFKDTWEKDADFTWLGQDIAKKVKEKLDNIPWDGIKTAASKFGKALATTINGFVEFPDIASTIGHSIAEAINTVINTFDSFVSNIHGDSIGTFIGELVGTALDDIEWNKYIHGMGELGTELANGINALAQTDVLSKISQSIANLLKGAIEGAYKFVTDVNWGDLGTKIGTAISDFFAEMNKVDDSGMTGFQKLGKTISGLATGLMDMMSTALANINWNEVGKSVIDFLTSIDWVNLFTSAATLKANISNALWQLFTLAIKGMAAIQVEVAVDLISKLEEAYNNAKEWLKTKIINFVTEFTLPKWEKGKGLAKKAESLGKSLKKAFKVGISLSYPKWEKGKAIYDNAVSLANKIKKLFDFKVEINTTAKSVAGNAVSNAANKATKAAKKALEKADGGIYSHGNWQKFATGGFPTHGSAFIAGESGAEMVGHINGQTEVLNKSQIAQAMSSAVVSGNAEQNALLRQQNQLLMQILQKESGISYKDVFKATQKGNNEYKAMNGVSAFI